MVVDLNYIDMSYTFVKSLSYIHSYTFSDQISKHCSLRIVEVILSQCDQIYIKSTLPWIIVYHVESLSCAQNIQMIEKG